MAKEILDIVDDNGQPTGEVIDRVTAHREGILHRTSHVWLVRMKDSRLQVLLQKRSEEKDSYPGCYDISSAGHIPAGVDFVPSALRELKEELGVEVQAEDLVYCGQRKFHFEEIFHGERFKDNQISNVYLNFRYDGSTLTCVTGTSLKVFTLDKSLDHAFDKWVEKFFAEHGIEYDVAL